MIRQRRLYLIFHSSLLSLAAEPILGSVHQTLDVALMLDDDEQSDDDGDDHQGEGDGVVYRIWQIGDSCGLQVSHDGYGDECSAGSDTTYGNVLGCNRQNNPDAKCGKCRDRTQAEEHAQCS